MNEIERVKQEALLSDEEIMELEPRFKEMDSFVCDGTDFDKVAEAQLEKLLKHKKVRIEADDQKLPEVPNFHQLNSPTAFNRRSGYKQAQQDMIDDGWVKCLERKEK